MEQLATLRSEVNKLISAEQYESADVVLNLFISSLSNAGSTNLNSGGNVGKDHRDVAKDGASNASLSELCELYGDVLTAKECYSRALHQYQQAMIYRKAATRSFRSSNLIHTAEEASLRYKECKCHMKLKDAGSALRELEVIPSRLRTLGIHALLGKLYHQNNMNTQAVTAYKAVLQLSPMAVEAIEALATLGQTAQETTAILNDAARGETFEELLANGWLNELTNWHTNRRNCEFEKNDIAMRKMLAIFPRNVYLLTQLGSAAIDAEKFGDALMYYKQIRRIDSLSMDGMDKFALMLHSLGDLTELNLLANDAFKGSNQVAPAWIVAALLADLEGQQDKSMSLLDKAIQIEPKYFFTYIIRGKLLHAHGHTKQASVAYYQANRLQKSLLSLSGLVESHLETARFSEAINMAKEALLLTPRSSSAYYLMGHALCKAPNGIEQGIKSLQKAVRLNPANKKAAELLAETLAGQNKATDAIKCLEEALNHVSCAKLRTQLAKLYATQERFNEAIDELHIAISLAPQDCTEATQELSRIDGLLRGSITQRSHGGNAGYGEEDDEQVQEQDGEEAEDEEEGLDVDDDGNESEQHVESMDRDSSRDRSQLHSRLFSDGDSSSLAGIDRALFADDVFASDSD